MHIFVDTIIHYPLINVSEYPLMVITYPSMENSSTDNSEGYKHVINNLNTTF